MIKRDEWFYILVGGSILILLASLQFAPGYMDAEYYFYTGTQLAAGHGFTENLIWNYLDQPNTLPHPSHSYWMPLISVLTAVGIRLFWFLSNYRASQLLFALLALFLPIFVKRLADKLFGDRGNPRLAGWLAVFSGYFLSYYLASDAFVIYMYLGGAFFYFLFVSNWYRYFALGFVIALMHLTRADGLFWLLIAGAAVIMERHGDLKDKSGWRAISHILIAYLLIISPWFLRNIFVFGSPIAPGGDRALWMVDYQDLFRMPASQLTFERWAQSGLGAILNARWEALFANLQTTIAVQGGIVSFFFILVGGWKLRDQFVVRIAGLAWLMIFAVMTLIFPFAGLYGGYFHAGAAFMPLIWALVPVGISHFSKYSSQRLSTWEFSKAYRMFSVILMISMIAVTAFVSYGRVVGVEADGLNWTQDTIRYQSLARRLQELGADQQDVVMIGNPPRFVLESGLPTVVTPSGGIEAVQAVVDEFNVSYFLLDPNFTVDLEGLYTDPTSLSLNIYDWQYVETFEGTHIFFIEEQP